MRFARREFGGEGSERWLPLEQEALGDIFHDVANPPYPQTKPSGRGSDWHQARATGVMFGRAKSHFEIIPLPAVATLRKPCPLRPSTCVSHQLSPATTNMFDGL